eukprot:scaffold9774_cov143-Isochrysis_galbana.AAC.1
MYREPPEPYGGTYLREEGPRRRVAPGAWRRAPPAAGGPFSRLGEIWARRRALYCFDEQHGRHRRHHQPIGAAAEPLGVCPEVADTDLAVLAAEGLATLKERHAVVKHARVHVQVHVRIADEPPRVPR